MIESLLMLGFLVIVMNHVSGGYYLLTSTQYCYCIDGNPSMDSVTRKEENCVFLKFRDLEIICRSSRGSAIEFSSFFCLHPTIFYALVILLSYTKCGLCLSKKSWIILSFSYLIVLSCSVYLASSIMALLLQLCLMRIAQCQLSFLCS